MKNGSNKNGKSKNESKNDDNSRRFGDKNVPLTGEQQRTLCFSLFNDYWRDAAKQGIDFDVVGTMSISAALFGIVSKHGKENVIQFIGDLGKSVENNEYSFQQS